MPKSNVTPYTTPTANAQTCTKVHQSLLAGATCLALLLAPACSPGGSDETDDPPSRRATTTTTAEPTTTTTSTEDAVREAYGDFVDMVTRLTTTTVDPNDPELAMRMTDPALSEVRTQLATWQAEGQIWVEGDLTRHEVEAVDVARDGLSAVVTDCVVANDALVAVGSADPPLPPPQTQRGTVTLVNQGGRWLVSRTDPGEHWEGVAGCAA
jgi:hypothetical protein